MIDKKEIDDKAKEFEIHSSNIQRDYVYGWFLAGIYSVSALKDDLVLKGGNCFRKAYFHNTRYSNDLDFSVATSLNESLIKDELNRVCDFVHEATGIYFDKEKNKVFKKVRVDSSKDVHEARVYFKDFYGVESEIIISIRLDITQFDKIYLPVQERNIIHPYSDASECSRKIRCLKLEEALASKLKCLLQRRHSSDLYDYVHWLFFDPGIDINKPEILNTLLKMTIFQRSPGALKNLLVELPFTALKELWSKFLICPNLTAINFDVAVEKFKTHILELFGNLPTYVGNLLFYPAQYRNLILDAGSNFNLMKITYDNSTRIIEPYSLSYKTRQDGVSQEYFYAWDRTGGNSGKQNIKIFLHPKIQNLERLEEKFEPRFDVELSKAGELPKNTYFSKPFSTRRIGSRKITTNYYGPTYIYECVYCGKQFKKKELKTILNKHKDKFNNQCFGRSGFLVDTKWS